MNKKTESPENNFNNMVRVRTIRAFALFFFFTFCAAWIYYWVVTGPKNGKAYGPFRRVMNFNAWVFSTSYKNPELTKEFPKSIASRKVRVNGDYGLKTGLDTSLWKLRVVRYSALSPLPSDTFYISLDEIKSMPKTEVVFNFKCIEGWSQITWWGGVRFSDFAAKFNIGTRSNQIPDPKNHPEDMCKYCGLITPDGGYYVGIDMPGMMHPQTILCYEMNGQPLPVNQGAPLRLIIPVKYGIKHLKRIGTIFFSDTPPPDYWAERGYDYFAGL